MEFLWARVGSDNDGQSLLEADQSAWAAVAAVLTAWVCDVQQVATNQAGLWMSRARWMAQQEHRAPQGTALEWAGAMDIAPLGDRLQVVADVLSSGGEMLLDAACETAAAVLQGGTIDQDVDHAVWLGLFDGVRPLTLSCKDSSTRLWLYTGAATNA